jgi:hypothetical protein
LGALLSGALPLLFEDHAGRWCPMTALRHPRACRRPSRDSESAGRLLSHVWISARLLGPVGT